MKINLKPQITRNYNTFKSNITFDIGGSQREGSCKIYYASTPRDEEFYREHTTVNDLGKGKFESGEDFVSHIIEKIGRIQKASKAIVKEKGYPVAENTLQNVAVFLPSYTYGEKAFYLPNLRNDVNKPLKDIDFSNFKKRLRSAGIDVADDMKFKVVQDAMGTGLAVAKRLYDNGMLEAGKYYTACITGGGCGVSNIEVIDDENIIVKSTGSSYLSQSLSLQKVSRAGASAPAIVENFCRAMGLNEEVIEGIKSCHKAEFALSEKAYYPKNVKTEPLREMLLDTGMFEIERENFESFIIKIKDEYIDKYNIARRNAIDKYCLALARLAIIKKNEGSNGIIVTGSLAKAVNICAKQRYGIGIGDWIMQHLTQSFNSYELDKMQEAYDFKALCDDRFFIDNNTECGELIHLAKFIGTKRNNWLKLGMKDIYKQSLRSMSKVL